MRRNGFGGFVHTATATATNTNTGTRTRTREGIGVGKGEERRWERRREGGARRLGGVAQGIEAGGG